MHVGCEEGRRYITDRLVQVRENRPKVRRVENRIRHNRLWYTQVTPLHTQTHTLPLPNTTDLSHVVSYHRVRFVLSHVAYDDNVIVRLHDRACAVTRANGERRANTRCPPGHHNENALKQANIFDNLISFCFNHIKYRVRFRCEQKLTPSIWPPEEAWI